MLTTPSSPCAMVRPLTLRRLGRLQWLATQPTALLGTPHCVPMREGPGEQLLVAAFHTREVWSPAR